MRSLLIRQGLQPTLIWYVLLSSCIFWPVLIHVCQLVFARKGSDVVDTVKRFDPTMLDTL